MDELKKIFEGMQDSNNIVLRIFLAISLVLVILTLIVPAASFFLLFVLVAVVIFLFIQKRTDG
ncbi:hypothetical protein KC726_03580 [Candidatus Woesebacteria bacterium]|nr:hypothetical protein [Candidatus Woesebacteria bacterium]